MADEKIVTNENDVVKDDSIEIIQNLKATTVSKDAYNQLQAEHNKLLKALAEGRTDPNGKPEAPKPTQKELDEEMNANIRYLGNGQAKLNTDSARALLKLNEDRISRGYDNIFLPQRGEPLPEDRQYAEMIVEILSDSLEKSKGDNDLFTTYVQTHLKDNAAVTKRR